MEGISRYFVKTLQGSFRQTEPGRKDRVAGCLVAAVRRCGQSVVGVSGVQRSTVCEGSGLTRISR
jgi:hypothetical protein